MDYIPVHLFKVGTGLNASSMKLVSCNWVLDLIEHIALVSAKH
ncbi:unnamed protein product [Musa acuminata subsp. malaccensis]|uniref:(wild Malaysian banana) hypothetical protein n=1 Tax=Musa acuminata subsp. malaccensis TaxID=214687 RepID=A0A804HZ76_MUSAM|nr:unnamed protein product [Musa acuminata subsp. malaccensis]